MPLAPVADELAVPGVDNDEPCRQAWSGRGPLASPTPERPCHPPHPFWTLRPRLFFGPIPASVGPAKGEDSAIRASRGSAFGQSRVPTCQEPCRDPSHRGSPVTSQLTRGGRGDSTRCFYSRTLFRLWRVTVPAPGTGITGPRTQPRQWKDQMTRELWGRARAPRPWFKQRGQEKRGSRCGPGCRTGRTAQLPEPSGRGTHRSFCLLFLLQNVGGCAFPLLFQLPNSRETQGTRERVASREQQSPALDPRPANSL